MGAPKKSSVLRYLRITVAVFFTVVCLATCALWARSNNRMDMLFIPDSGRFGQLAIYTHPGRLSLSSTGNPYASDIANNRWKHVVRPVDADRGYEWNGTLGFHLLLAHFFILATIPLWFPAVLSGLISIFLFSRVYQRFSLQTLLITATLLCLVLGFAAATTR